MEGKSMKTRNFALLAVLVVVGVAFAATPASAINTCATICNCTVTCSTSCLWAGPEGTGENKEWVIYAESCGEYGVCAGQGSCGGVPGNCPAQACTSTWNGTSGGDTKFGGAAHECLNGLAGNDTIDGGAGDDTIHGNDGTDTLTGNSGNDCLYGDNQNDNLDGNSGTDLADGGAGTGDVCTAETKVNCP
jgi:hypothetical protein